MRQSRQNSSWVAAVAITSVLAFAMATTTPVRADETPSPTPTATPNQPVTPTPTATPEPTLAPTPTPTSVPEPTTTPSLPEPPSIVCESGWVNAETTYVHVGGPVRVPISGFPPNVAVTMFVGSIFDIGVGQPEIGTGMTDGHGAAMVTGIVPTDARAGEQSVTVKASDDCWAEAFVVISLSPLGITIDEETVMPGQRVTVRAGGFLPKGHVVITIDTFPTQGECWPRPCRVLGMASTSSTGSVVTHVRIPRDTTPGPHSVWVSGYLADGMREDSFGVDILVGPGATLPPTDTVLAE